jgi:hypothetical protein
VQEIFRWQRERAGLSGLSSTASGAVCFPHRFGGSMNLNVHFHVVVPDGVFTAAKSATRADFRRLPPPDRMDLETLTVNVEMRVVAWLRRRGLLDNAPDEPPTEPVARTALDACVDGSLGLGELTVLRSRRGPIDDGHEALLRLPGPNGAVATCEASTCMRGWSCLRATAKAANGSSAIAPGPRSASSV